MKKIAILALLALVATGAFAQGFQMSAGGGAFFDYSFNNGISGSFSSVDSYLGIRNLSIGAYGFFDATYVEVGVGISYGSLSLGSEGWGSFVLAMLGGSDDFGSAVQLDLTLLGKYPIDLGAFTIFPLLGVSYNMVLSHTIDGNSNDSPSDLNQFGILAGAGLDFNLTDSLYLRGEALFHLRFASKFADDLSGSGWDTTLGMGPRIRVGVGYRF